MRFLFFSRDIAIVLVSCIFFRAAAPLAIADETSFHLPRTTTAIESQALSNVSTQFTNNKFVGNFRRIFILVALSIGFVVFRHQVPLQNGEVQVPRTSDVVIAHTITSGDIDEQYRKILLTAFDKGRLEETVNSIYKKGLIPETEMFPFSHDDVLEAVKKLRSILVQKPMNYIPPSSKSLFIVNPELETFGVNSAYIELLVEFPNLFMHEAIHLLEYQKRIRKGMNEASKQVAHALHGFYEKSLFVNYKMSDRAELLRFPSPEISADWEKMPDEVKLRAGYLTPNSVRKIVNRTPVWLMLGYKVQGETPAHYFDIIFELQRLRDSGVSDPIAYTTAKLERELSKKGPYDLQELLAAPDALRLSQYLSLRANLLINLYKYMLLVHPGEKLMPEFENRVILYTILSNEPLNLLTLGLALLSPQRSGLLEEILPVGLQARLLNDPEFAKKFYDWLYQGLSYANPHKHGNTISVFSPSRFLRRSSLAAA